MATHLDHKRAAAALPTSKAQPPSSYRDDPEAVSLHTTRSDYEYNDDLPELPSYHDSVAAPANSPSAPIDAYRSISQPTLHRPGQNASSSHAVSIGCETSIRMEESLMDPASLQDYITNYLRNVPPRPLIRIQGSHWQHTAHANNKKKEKERVYDFDIVFSLQPFLPEPGNGNFCQAYTVENGDQAYRGSFRKMRAKGYKQDIEVGEEEKPTLTAWCEEFCSSKSWLKIFRISRHVHGLDIEQITPALEKLVRATHYRGRIDITYPMVDKNVDIYSPHWINTARITWIRWIFYLTFLWLITWPILYFMTKRWSTYNVNWYWKMYNNGPEGSVERYATISESDWIKRHANLVQSLVLDKYHGDASEVPSDIAVNTERRRSEIRVPNVNLRGGGIGAAVGLLQSGVSVWNQANGRGDAGWGSDEC
ncbi:hypothetical protein CB0940_02261 [Cercospora beticola]|uniref:Uncharacterized protein n=1 Tax=Cercospora beticola TaxID=122368 RepID=A0A2G5IC82_CERBT|nr:hypothetical protein CB0940_02261 [Cercospora beticola]PIB02083.1 hypothetical protein CB0940_02261 [Cercospora beticola]WPA97573.1 hypothetical protein RHO25_002183 [Cercospora beticola]CAK1358757.1 unnamed protein product [Cercospora beticola]